MATPIKSFRMGSVVASIWNNPVVNDGKTIERFSVKIVRKYKKDAQWTETSSFFPEDLLKLSLISVEAYKYLALKEKDSPQKNENDVEGEDK